MVRKITNVLTKFKTTAINNIYETCTIRAKYNKDLLWLVATLKEINNHNNIKLVGKLQIKIYFCLDSEIFASWNLGALSNTSAYMLSLRSLLF